jgi:hypothetical protein
MFFGHLETLIYVLLTTFVIFFNRKLVAKDLTILQKRNDQFIVSSVKIWSSIFIVVMAVSILWTRQYLSIRQLNTFLIISLSGLFIDQFSLGGYVFTSMSSLSWFELLSMFLETPSGLNISRFYEPKWMLSFYVMTSVALAGHLREKRNVLRVETSSFQFACVALVWSVAPLVHSICHNFLPEMLPLVRSWNDVPIRMEELECGAWYRVITLSCMALMHFGTRQLILSVDGDDEQLVATSKKKDETSKNIPGGSSKGSAQHTPPQSPVAEEGGVEESADSQQLPGDAVEVSEEEALRLYQGAALKQRTAR